MDNEAVRSFFVKYGIGEYLMLGEISPEEEDGLPALWKEALGFGSNVVASKMSEIWRQVCPRMPRIAALLERRLLGIGLARLPGYEGNSGPELYLAYIMSDPWDIAEFAVWFGGRPVRVDCASWSPAANLVLGSLHSDLHDGFVDLYRDSGILPVSEVVSARDRWRGVLDCGELRVVRGVDDFRALPGDHEPDFDDLFVIAQQESHGAWAVSANSDDGSGWYGEHDVIYPIRGLAEDIETMIGITIGAIEREEF